MTTLTHYSIESRWTDVKTSVVALLSVCSAMVFPSKAVACEDSKSPKRTVLPLKAQPTTPVDAKEHDKESGKNKDKDGDQDKDKDNINLPGPLPSIPIPKIPPMPTLSLDDIMDKVHGLGEKISEEIKGRVPTLADYFSAVDTIWKELQLGDGSLYQSIVSNMSDSTKNPEIQLDAIVRYIFM